MTYLSAAQVEQLLKPIHPSRVSQRDGLSHLEAYDVRAHLNRIFGFGRWSADLIDLTALYETVEERSKDGRTWQVVSVGYRATMRLTVCAPDGTVLATYTEAAAGSATNFPINKRSDAADFAIKTAESQALKRCVTNLGDQFGLSLYQKGSRDALVKRTLVVPDGDTPTEDVAHDVAPVTPETVEEVQPQGQATSTASSAADMSAGAAPAAPPSSPEVEPQAANEPQVMAQKLRDQALALFHDRANHKRGEVLADLGKINLAASRHRLQTQMVRRENGEEVSLNVFVNELITQCSRNAA